MMTCPRSCRRTPDSRSGVARGTTSVSSYSTPEIPYASYGQRLTATSDSATPRLWATCTMPWRSYARCSGREGSREACWAQNDHLHSIRQVVVGVYGPVWPSGLASWPPLAGDFCPNQYGNLCGRRNRQRVINGNKSLMTQILCRFLLDFGANLWYNETTIKT
jgi:hypothetical protein